MVEWREVLVSTLAEPAKIKLIKYAKGYGWEISFSAEFIDDCLIHVREADKRLRELYGGSHEEQKA